MQRRIALFGETEKGESGYPRLITSVPLLSETLGHPPFESRGIFYAIQFLLYGYEVIFVPVKEEGFSTKDYLRGLNLLHDKKKFSSLSGLCLPGVGDAQILDATLPLCDTHKCCLITSERDLYDYLTSLQLPAY